ncbi:MAG TPA: phosphoglycerate kinase [Candidatus Gracilibacteria bacterium]|nr:phosphoglycerate kinase [Candidatus Gracilibacteria bacterium]
MKIRSIKSVDVDSKKVLIRVDFNVPLENGQVSDDTRIKATLPTLQHLIDNRAKIIIITHLGRPEGKVVEELRLDPVAKKLSELLGKEVKKVNDCIGPEVEAAIEELQPGHLLLLENVRFHAEETDNSEEFSKKLAALADLMVIDSFGTAHRAHASTYGAAKLLPAYGGFLIEKEIQALSQVMHDVERPLTIIMGGAKIETKIGIMRKFVSQADHFLVGGGLGNTFLAAEGFDVGESLYEEDKKAVAQEILLEAEALKDQFHIPTDVIVADEVKEDAKKLDIPAEDVMGDMKILDIGVNTIKKFEEVIAKSKTIVWNGPLGLFEMDAFSRGTRHIAIAVANSEAKTIIGGGDTIDAIKEFGIDLEKYDHVSTGGGAMLQFLEGEELPGIEVIREGH